MTVKGAPPVPRYFVAGDESELLVSNGADPKLGQLEHIARNDVGEIKGPKPYSRKHDALDGLGCSQLVSLPSGRFQCSTEHLATMALA